MITPWHIINEQEVRVGYRTIIRRLFQLPDGQQAEFDLIKGKDVVCVLALTTDNNVILAEQFRPGPGQVLLELPGGAIDDGEQPLQAAARELAEETGYTGMLQLVAHTPIDAYNTAHRYHFIATDCQFTATIQNDDHEFTEARLMSLTDFQAHLRHGQLTDVATGFLGLDFLRLL